MLSHWLFKPLTAKKKKKTSLFYTSSSQTRLRSHVWHSAPFSDCRRTVCCFTALIMKQSLQGKHGIPRPGSHLRAESAEEAANHTMYRQRTFLGGDPRLGAPHSPGFTGTTVKRKGCCQGTRLSTSPDTREKGKQNKKPQKTFPTLRHSAFAQTKLRKPRKALWGFFYVILTRRTVPVRKEWVIFLIIGGWHLNLSPLCLAHTRTDTKVISTLLNSSPDTDDMEVLMYQKLWSHERRHKHTHTHLCSPSCVHTHNSRHTGSCGPPVRLHGQLRCDWRGPECCGAEPGQSRIC